MITQALKDAIFSDETKQFVSPYDPSAEDTVIFKIRVAANKGCEARLHFNDGTFYEMKKTEYNSVFEFFTVSVKISEKPIRYFYTILWGGQTVFFNKRGVSESLFEHYNFRLVPGYKTPDWAKGAVMYQVFTDRFYNGNPTNDVISHEYAYLGVTAKALPWDKDITVGDFCNFYGGDLQGIMDKMEYLTNLGVEVIYVNPIFVSPSSHKYDTQDYDYIDPHFGVIKEDCGEILRFENVNNKFATKYIKRTTCKINLEASNELMAKFIEKAHGNGIKIILDGAFNHCGSFNKWMDAAGFYKFTKEEIGAYHSKDSPYHDYFVWHGEHPTNKDYEGWWNNPNHPKLNYENSRELFDYILEVAKKWVSPPYNADGWRLDVAADLGQSSETNHKFWREFHKTVKAANPNAIILAEHYGDPSPWLNGKEWDTIMNYDAFMEPLSWFFTGVNKHSEESRPHLKNDAYTFENLMRHHMSYLNVHALQSSMNQLSNHDHSRFLTRTNGNTGRWHTLGPRAAETGVNKNILMAAIVFQMTWPGAPTIYYGDEAGLAGWTDPDNRRPFPWGKEDITLTNLYKSLSATRKQYSVLRHGSVEFLLTDYGFLSYARWDENQKIIVAINNGDRPYEASIPVWKAEIFDGQLTGLFITENNSFFHLNCSHTISGGELKLTMPANSSIVLIG